uniref:Uncharacterized protein n=1 Tax=Chromera velia CCMP2878 TaxID=1169474 RepID=A0A0K6SB06_9ALVE|eukprot:Cvel_11936.t1-p1 / transcript=Cvel_11936.t1 / gene=Cvel_11936 / organism=Chromera_velia_CCMP2878 / gene_product=hypothetical protein / transcript_product=hypothetical protein / location=Cvel_scaffold764:58820-61540(+) / protein_length=907 / sequence_SO=supercontig / SO=protein_coding / is_pseudo=false
MKGTASLGVVLGDHSDVRRFVVASGFLGFSEFWRAASVSREFLEKRDDPSTCGLGSILPALASHEEREAVWKLIDDCLKRDNVTPLQQLLKVDKLEGRYPFLLRRAQDKTPQPQACIAFLATRSPTPVYTEPPLFNHPPRVMADDMLDPRPPTAESLRDLLQKKTIDPNAWVEIGITPPDTYPPTDAIRERQAKPLLIYMIEQLQFDCANVLLDFEARVDVCEWRSEWLEFGCDWEDLQEEADDDSDPSRYQRCGTSPLHSIISSLKTILAKIDYEECDEEEETEEGQQVMQKRQTGLSLLKRVTQLMKTSGCLYWAKPEEVTYELDVPTAGETALEAAVRARDTEALPILLEAFYPDGKVGRSVNDLPVLAFERMSGIGSRERHDTAVANTISLLAEAGANVLMPARKNRTAADIGDTPLAIAKILKYPMTASVILKNGGQLQSLTHGTERLSLMGAIKEGNDFFAGALARGGGVSDPVTGVKPVAELAEHTEKGGNPTLISTLQAAFVHGISYATVKALVRNGARCPLTHPPEGPHSLPLSQLSPVLLACSKKRPWFSPSDLVRTLCGEGGADPNIPGKIREGQADLEYPLLHVVGHPLKDLGDEKTAEAVRTLVDFGAEVDVTRPDGHTALSLACSLRKKLTAQCLLERGASVEGVRNQAGRRKVPLIEAIVSEVVLREKKAILSDEYYYEEEEEDSEDEEDENVIESVFVPPSSIPLISMLILEWGADPNAMQVLALDFRPPPPTRVSPLLLASLLCLENKSEIALPLAKMLIAKGARCPVSFPPAEQPVPSPAAAAAAAASDNDDSDSLHPVCRVSPLMVAVQCRDPALIATLCEPGGAGCDPNRLVQGIDPDSEEGKPDALPLVVALTHRRVEFCSEKHTKQSRTHVERQWDVIKQVLLVG